MLDCLHERVGRRRLINWMAEREIQHVDAEEILVRNRELDGAHDVRRVALAFLVEHAQANQPRVGRDTDELARDQPRHVRAMTVRIHGRHCADIALGKVVERGDAIVEVGARLDARVDHRDADAGASARLRIRLERGVVDRLVVELGVGMDLRRPDWHRREKLLFQRARRPAFAHAIRHCGGRILQRLLRVDQRVLRVERHRLGARCMRARGLQGILGCILGGLDFGQPCLRRRDRRNLRVAGQAIGDDERPLGRGDLRVGQCGCFLRRAHSPLRLEHSGLCRNERRPRVQHSGLQVAREVLNRDRPVQRHGRGRVEGRKRREVVAVDVGRDGIERGKFAVDDVAVGGERVAKSLAIAGFGSDDDRLGSDAAALDRLAKRLIELRIGRRLRIQNAGNAQGRDAKSHHYLSDTYESGTHAAAFKAN